jgi:hypothetical protein
MSNYPGFDCYAFPGANVMSAWKSQSPYGFVGYYLLSDNHTDNSWLGNRASLQAGGWGLAVLYVALPATSSNLTRQRGMTDAGDALSQCQNDGFAGGTIVYLDVEPVDSVPQPLIDYYKGWIRGILDSKTTASPYLAPGTYCHAKNANDLYNAAQQEYADAGLPSGAPAFWITKSDPQFNPASSAPTDSGVSFANLWQGKIDVKGETWGGFTLDIDWDVADSPDPSAPKSVPPLFTTLAATRAPEPDADSAQVCNLLRSVTQEVFGIAAARDSNARQLFPNGVDLVDIEVAVGGATVKLKLAGPQKP